MLAPTPIKRSYQSSLLNSLSLNWTRPSDPPYWTMGLAAAIQETRKLIRWQGRRQLQATGGYCYWSISADLFCSDRLDARQFLVKGLLVLETSEHQVCLSRTNQHWLTMHLMTTMWSIGRPPLFWTENPTKVLDGLKRQYIFGQKDGNPWTGTRGSTHWATRTTNFLPCRVTIVARTGRGIEQTSSDEGLW